MRGDDGRPEHGRRPLVGVVSCSRVLDGRPVQAIADRFLLPLGDLSDLAPLVVPSLDGRCVRHLAGILDAVLLTGSDSNVDPARYGGGEPRAPLDPARDETALSLADAMASTGRPVFGICRGMQEIAVLHGGTLTRDLRTRTDARHGSADGAHDRAIGSVIHAVTIGDGPLDRGRVDVVSAHGQCVDRLGTGLVAAATSDDGLVEAVFDPAHGAILGVQWHPEWDVATSPTSRAFFRALGDAARGRRFAAVTPVQRTGGVADRHEGVGDPRR